MWTENIFCVFGVKTPFPNFPAVAGRRVGVEEGRGWKGRHLKTQQSPAQESLAAPLRVRVNHMIVKT